MVHRNQEVTATEVVARPVSEPSADRTWMLWDGECNFCRRAAAWFKRHDPHNRIRPCPYQQAPTPPMTPDIYTACENAVHVVTPEGRVLRAGQATLHLLETVGYVRLARLLRRRPFIQVVEAMYALVANNRDFFARFVLTREDDHRTDLIQP